MSHKDSPSNSVEHLILVLSPVISSIVMLKMHIEQVVFT
jgi:hypothetical protein